ADLGGSVESMALTESSFGGAGSMRGHASLFGMELKEHPAYDATHTARISVFMVGDRVIALGSGVRNEDTAHPTRTTLFQVCPEVMTEPAEVQSGKNWVTDPADNGYVVMAGPELTHRTGEQTAPDQDGSGEATRVYSLAHLDHGAAPHDSGYAYVLLVQGGPDGTAEFAQQVQDEKSPVVIQQRDRVAHVVSDAASGVTAYTVSEPDTARAGRALVRRANCQVLVMTRKSMICYDMVISSIG